MLQNDRILVPHYLSSAGLPEWNTCTGKNRKHVLVIATESDATKNSDLLRNILSAIDLDIEQDIHCLTLHEDAHVALVSDPEIKNYSRVIAFGPDVERLGLHVERSSSGIYHFDTFSMLLAPALDTISAQPAIKKSLWGALKDLFPESRAKG